MNSSNRLPLGALAELEKMRGSAVAVYCTNDRTPRNLAAGDPSAFSQVLQWPSKPNRLDFVLHTEGGLISAARALALLLRDASPRVDILVPYKARSAGTLLCLAANEVVLGPLAEFSPIDPLIRSGMESSATLPKKISSEDIRCFREMAESWFDLRSEESRMQIFSLLNQRFFPSTLSAFFRADRYVRKVGLELLEFQLPRATVPEKMAIVDHLVTGYSSHHDPIGRREILKLGLRAKEASESESRLLGTILAETQCYLNPPLPRTAGPRRRCRAVFFNRHRGTQFVTTGGGPRAEAPVEPDEEEATANPPPSVSGEWEDIAFD